MPLNLANLSQHVERATLVGAGNITSNARNNVLTGNGEDNDLTGSNGNDSMFGASGDDRQIVDLVNNHLSTNLSGFAVITAGANTITLENVSAASLTAGDFIF